MDLSLKDDQQMLRDTFARFLDEHSSTDRVRKALEAGGFDRALWEGLAELGTFAMRVPEDAGGLGLGALDAVLVTEEAGRTLASGPVCEAIVAARLIGQLGGDALGDVTSGAKVVTLAYHDIASRPVQWIAGGAHADLVVARKGDTVVLVAIGEADRKAEATLADNGLAELDLGVASHTVLGTGPQAVDAFAAAFEEWQLLMAAALNGLARQSVKLAAEYACERKAFGVPIGTYQAMSHPLAEFISAVEGGNLLVWKILHEIAAGEDVGHKIPLALWFNANVASRASIQSLRTFGGYGLTTEYDIFLYNLRAKALPLTLGDPQRLLANAGRRLYAGERTVLPDVGEVPFDFELGEEAAALAAEVDAFFQSLSPEELSHAHHSWDGHVPSVHKRMAEAGLLFPELPPEKGGRGANPYASHAAGKVWAKYNWSGHSKGTTMMTAAIIDRYGSDELKEEVLKPILAGDAICSLGYSEPGSGSDVFAAQTRAVPDGNGWRIDGTKMFTSGANISDYVLMLTRTNPDVPKHKGLTMFIVPTKAEGFAAQPVYTFQDERTNITFYDGVHIPDSYRLGEIDKGVITMSAALELEHGGGFSDEQFANIEAAAELCRQIDADGGGKLIDTEAAQIRLARAYANALAGEMLGLRSLWSAREGKNLPASGPMSKMYTTDRYLDDASDLIDLTAPLSLSKRKGAAEAVNLAYRFAHATTIWAGTSEIHRSMIAEKALGLPRSRG